MRRIDYYIVVNVEYYKGYEGTRPNCVLFTALNLDKSLVYS